MNENENRDGISVIPPEAELAVGDLRDEDKDTREKVMKQRKEILARGIASIEKRKELEAYYNKLNEKYKNILK
jgi:hypothetical protein